MCVCVWMWGGLLKHISVNFIFIRALPQLLEDPTIKTIFFSGPEILMAEERRGAGEGVESAITVSVYGWLNYNLRFISSSWRCQRRGRKEVSLWQRWILEDGFVLTNVRLPFNAAAISYIKASVSWARSKELEKNQLRNLIRRSTNSKYCSNWNDLYVCFLLCSNYCIGQQRQP